MFTHVNPMVPAAIALAGALALSGCGKQTEVATTTEPTSRETQADASAAATARREAAATRRERGAGAPGEESPSLTVQDARRGGGDADEERVRQAREERRAASLAARERDSTASQERLARPAVVTAEPARLDVGQMPVREKRSGVVTLTNTSDTIVRLQACRTSCGCTAANCPTSYDMQPGEALDVTVELSGGVRPERLTKSVTFIFEDHPNVVTQVAGESIAYVSLTPTSIDPETNPDGRLVLRSHDDEPFRVLSVNPLLAVNLPEEAATEHEIYISWDQWAELRRPRTVEFTTDHPVAGQVMGTIRAPRPTTSPTDRAGRPVSERRQVEPRVRTVQELTAAGSVDDVLQQIAQGADVDSADAEGMSLLGIAAQHGHVDLMRALIDASADVNYFSGTTGRTPLMNAALFKNPEGVRMLLDAGADVNARDMQLGNSALSWAAFHGNAETVQLLLDGGAALEVVSRMISYTPLLWAAGWGETGSLELLIEAGADVNVVCSTPKSSSALMYAAETGRVANVKALIRAGADLEVKDMQRRTALILAAASADADTVRALVEGGADVHAKDARDRTALDHAQARNDEKGREIATILERHIKD